VARLHPKHGSVNDVCITISKVLLKTKPLIIKYQEFAILA
jgi:hypothetical protein